MVELMPCFPLCSLYDNFMCYLKLIDLLMVFYGATSGLDHIPAVATLGSHDASLLLICYLIHHNNVELLPKWLICYLFQFVFLKWISDIGKIS